MLHNLIRKSARSLEGEVPMANAQVIAVQLRSRPRHEKVCNIREQFHCLVKNIIENNGLSKAKTKNTAEIFGSKREKKTKHIPFFLD